MSRAVVIGAVNMDICGKPAEPLIMRDSNPGSVTMTPGGVGRNIAHDLRLLGIDVTFITAIGDDVYATDILNSCSALGFDMHLSRRVPNRRTSTYLYITDAKGEMALAVCDTDVTDTLNEEYLYKCLDDINSADAVVIDGNLTSESIRFIAENCTAPLYADPVSVTKADRLLPILPKLTAFKPNQIEAMHLSGKSEPVDAAIALSKTGIGRVFCSLGANGIIAIENDTVITVPCEQTHIVNTTGAGDAVTAAIIWSGINGLSLEETARAAMKAGALTISCEETNSPNLSPKMLL